jgi:hypothetical protein
MLIMIVLHGRAGSRLPVRPRLAVLAIAVLILGLPACTDIYGARDRDLEILWPRNGATLVDEEVFGVRLRGYDLDEYDVYWYVDDSREQRMWDDWYSRPQQKSYIVDTWFWDWRGRGPYTVGFIAEDRRGRQLAHRTVRVYVR